MLKIEERIYCNQLFHIFSSSCVRFTSREQQHSREVNIYMCTYIYHYILYLFMDYLNPQTVFTVVPRRRAQKREAECWRTMSTVKRKMVFLFWKFDDYFYCVTVFDQFSSR